MTDQPKARTRQDRLQMIELGIRTILDAVGEDPTSERLRDTPARVARMWLDFYAGQEQAAPERLSIFPLEKDHPEQMVIVSDMRVYSWCEHHLLPFYVDVSIGYISAGQVLGLSKFARIAHACAARLQLQERLVIDIANAVEKATGSGSVAVIASGKHSCMLMRGVRTDHVMTSSEMRGAFMESPATRAEFMQLLQLGRGAA